MTARRVLWRDGDSRPAFSEQAEAVRKHLSDLRQRQRLDAGGSQLQGQRDAFQGGADSGDRADVLRAKREPPELECAVHEQPGGIVAGEGGDRIGRIGGLEVGGGEGERRHGAKLLTVYVQRLPAGRQDGKGGAGPK